MALNSLFCADVPLSNYSLTHFAFMSGLSLGYSSLYLRRVSVRNWSRRLQQVRDA